MVVSSAWAAGDARHVLLIGLDGVRPDALQAAATPNLDGLVQSGAVTWTMRTEDISLSGPGWSSMLTGVTAAKHGVTNNSFIGARYGEYPHFFERLRSVCPDASLASVATWSGIGRIVLDSASVGEAGGSDGTTTARAVELLSTGDPVVLFVHLDDVDAAGHGSGFSPTNPAYINAIQTKDAQVGQILDAVRARPGYAAEEWLVMVSTDHGGLGTGHGGGTVEEQTIFAIFQGPGVTPGVITQPTNIEDIAVTALAYLGVPLNPAWGLDGQVRGLGGALPRPALGCEATIATFATRVDQATKTVDLAWTPPVGVVPAGYVVRRDGAAVATLAATARQYRDAPVAADEPSGHLRPAYVVEAVDALGNVLAASATRAVRVSTGRVVLDESFDAYADDAALRSAGWQTLEVNSPVEPAGWTITNAAGRSNPPGEDGRATVGGFVISDSDFFGSASASNPTGSGMSYDLITPAFNATALSRVFLHADVSAQLNDNGRAVFDVDVRSSGRGWQTVLRRVSPSRTANAPVVTVDNADGFFGRLTLDLTAAAAGRNGVQVRLRHVEPNWDWWVAVDNVLVDDVDRTGGPTVELLAAEGFDGGVPLAWETRGVLPAGFGWSTADVCGKSIVGRNGSVFPFLAGRAIHRLRPPFASVQVECAGTARSDEWLLTPAVDARGLRRVWAEFECEFLPGGDGVVEVLLSLDGGATFAATPVFSSAGGGLLDGDEEPVYQRRALELPGAGTSDAVVVAFRYRSASAGRWWGVDGVRVFGQRALGCEEDLVAPFGTLDSADVLAFVGRVSQQAEGADLDGDGAVTFLDLLAYVEMVEAGCP